MSRDKFSPTPWHVEVRGDYLHIVDADDCDVAEMDEWDEQFEDEQTANFALMCAAPRLLHALEALVQEAALELGETYPPVVAAREAIKIAKEGA